jgi:hypothetical protein
MMGTHGGHRQKESSWSLSHARLAISIKLFRLNSIFAGTRSITSARRSNDYKSGARDQLRRAPAAALEASGIPDGSIELETETS